jgi:hypothetical protein
MSKRKLASVQKIRSLEPIEGADRIEKATILGWELVVEKGLHKVGDLVVYCEVDSILPERDEFAFLASRKYRIKTIKLRGQISQGICFPLSILPYRIKGYKEGDDVTEILGVCKYDPQGEKEKKRLEQQRSIYNNRMTKFLRRYKWWRSLFNRHCPYQFPKFIPKTDEHRIQLFPDICEKEKGTKFDICEKLDGQSATYFIIKNRGLSRFWKPYIFGVCSRNLHLRKEDNSSYWTIARKYNIEQKFVELLKLYDMEFAVQGEIIGTGIQGNKYKLDGYDFYVFNVRGLSPEDKYGNRLDTKYMSFFCHSIGLKTVPILFRDINLKESISEMVKLATRKSVLRDIEAEGIVCRNYQKDISFKVINPEFLLKNNE